MTDKVIESTDTDFGGHVLEEWFDDVGAGKSEDQSLAERKTSYIPHDQRQLMHERAVWLTHRATLARYKQERDALARKKKEAAEKVARRPYELQLKAAQKSAKAAAKKRQLDDKAELRAAVKAQRVAESEASGKWSISALRALLETDGGAIYLPVKPSPDDWFCCHHTAWSFHGLAPVLEAEGVPPARNQWKQCEHCGQFNGCPLCHAKVAAHEKICPIRQQAD